ncbi:MAG: alkaline phosphatase family protein [Chitinophagaceae bacterium]
MNKIFIIALILFQAGSLPAQTKKAIFIIADGIPADVIEKVKTPALDAIAKVGGYANAHVGGEKGGYSQTPTISAVGYNSLLTGTWVNKHNVWGNDIKAPNYNYWNIFRFLESVSPQKKTAVFSTWLDNRTKLVGDGLATAGDVHIDHHMDGMENDTLRFPHDDQREFMHRIDEQVVDSAAAYIRSAAPDLTWVYLEYTDDMGHKYGDHHKLYTAVEYLDKQVQRIWESVQYREKNFRENWVIYITTDHGRDSITGKNHGGQSDRERNTWIFTNAKGLNDYFYKHQPGIVDIMPSISLFLDIQIPREQRMEIDGIPVTGKLSAVLPKAILYNDHLTINWKAMQKKSKVKIWLTTSNYFKTGGKDNYSLVAEVPLEKEEAVIDVAKFKSSFYKIVIEGPDNFCNVWVGQ